MYCKIAIATLAVFVGYDFVSAQHIPPTTTAAELWNPWTWFWPYAKAAAEGYADYYGKAQKATNELYQQIYKTNAFPWVTGNWGPPQNNLGGNTQQNSTQSQGGNAGQTNQNNAPQAKPQNSETTQQNNPQPTDNQTGSNSGTGTQVQGNAKEDGTVDAGANVDDKQVNV